MMNSSHNSKQVIHVGFALPDPNVHDVTGYCAAEMAFEQANNDKEFPFEIELIPIIDNKDIQIGRKAADHFVEDPLAVAVLGPIWSPMAVVTQDIYNSAGLLQLTSEASSPLLTKKSYKNFFRLVANDELQGRELGKVAVKYLNAKRIAVLSDNTDWGKPIAEIFLGEIEKHDRKAVLRYFFSEKEAQLNFEQLIEETLLAKPDLVYFAVYWNKAQIIAHRLRDRGLEAVFLGSDALKPYPFLEVPGLDRVSPYHSLAGVDMRIKPSARGFYKQFALKYPMLLIAPQYAAEAYDAARLIVESIRRSGKMDRGLILKEMQNMGVYHGAVGEIEFDEKGDLMNAEISLYQCKEGLRNYLGSIKELVGD